VGIACACFKSWETKYVSLTSGVSGSVRGVSGADSATVHHRNVQTITKSADKDQTDI